MADCPIVQLTQELIRCPSLTPQDAGCQEILQRRLAELGFEMDSLPYGKTLNLWAWRGAGKPCLVFAGHTDVVPTGDLSHWLFPPFAAQLDGTKLYGRGAADMKGGIAAMVFAIERFIASGCHRRGKIALLITSDEEGPAKDGTVRVVEELCRRGEKIDYCLVGEPSSTARVGDTIKRGRRGSLSGFLTLHGVQGHVAYHHLADNPIPRALPLLSLMASHDWGQMGGHFPATTFQIVNLHAGVGASNVIPGALEVEFNFRYGSEGEELRLKEQVEEFLKRGGVEFTLDWHHAAKPFFTPDGPLIEAAIAAVRSSVGLTPTLSTSGGTSDGRFISQTGAQVVEVGLLNATIHKINEFVEVTDLRQLSQIYYEILCRILAAP